MDRLFRVSISLEISATEASQIQEAEGKKGEEIGHILSRLLQDQISVLVSRATMKNDRKRKP